MIVTYLACLSVAASVVLTVFEVVWPRGEEDG